MLVSASCWTASGILTVIEKVHEGMRLQQPYLLKKSRRTHIGLALVMLSLWVQSPDSLAHGGDDHAEKVPMASGWLPRAEAASEQFELVLVADGAHAWLYLTDFASSAAIEGAEISVDLLTSQAGSTSQAPQTLTAQADSQLGRYRLDWQAPSAGEYQVTATIVTKDAADVLTLTLPIEPASEFVHQHSFAEFKTPLLWGVAVILISAVAWVGWRRHRHGGAHV